MSQRLCRRISRWTVSTSDTCATARAETCWLQLIRRAPAKARAEMGTFVEKSQNYGWSLEGRGEREEKRWLRSKGVEAEKQVLRKRVRR
eukprot:5880117-Pleurochrysis_carterae.AAC.2